MSSACGATRCPSSIYMTDMSILCITVNYPNVNVVLGIVCISQTKPHIQMCMHILIGHLFINFHVCTCATFNIYLSINITYVDAKDVSEIGILVSGIQWGKKNRSNNNICQHRRRRMMCIIITWHYVTYCIGTWNQSNTFFTFSSRDQYSLLWHNRYVGIQCIAMECKLVPYNNTYMICKYLNI
jgi:hypothetical protein